MNWRISHSPVSTRGGRSFICRYFISSFRGELEGLPVQMWR